MMDTNRPGSHLEFHAISVLRKELLELDRHSSNQRKMLKKTQNKLEKTKSNLLRIKQQIDLFTQETNRALEGFKDTNWQFTKEVCAEIPKIRKPNETLLDLTDKFLLMIEQKDRSWKSFKAVTKNFAPLKSLMSNLQPESLTDEQVNDLLDIWKNQQSIQARLKKYCKGVQILASWINYSVEFKLKKETLKSVELSFPETFKKKNALLCKISEINSEILCAEERIAEIRICMESVELRVEEDNTDFSSCSKSARPEERAIVTTPLHQGTASGGILQRNSSITPRFPRQFFPDFELNSDELYVEAPTKKVTEEEVKTILYDDLNENIMDELITHVNSSIFDKTALFVETNPNLTVKSEIFLKIFEHFVGKSFEKLLVVGTDVFSCKKLIRKFHKARPDVPAAFLSADINEQAIGGVVSRVEKMKIEPKDANFMEIESKPRDLIKEGQIIVCTLAYFFRKGKNLFNDDFLVILEDSLQLDVKAIDHLSVNIDLKLVSSAIRGIQELSDLVALKRSEQDPGFLSFVETLRRNPLIEALPLDKFPRGVSSTSEMLKSPVPGNMRRPEFFLKLLKTVCVYIRSSLRALEPSINSCHYFLYNLLKTWLVTSDSLKYSSALFSSLVSFFSADLDSNENFFSLYVISEFLSLSALHPEIYSVIYEPHSEQPSVRSPILQLSCQDPSVYLSSLLASFRCKVLFTSSYSQVSRSFLGTSSEVFFFPVVPDICSLVLTRGSDQLFLSTKSDEKADDGVIRNYGEVLLDLSEVVPDGLLAVFPDWKTLMTYVVKWNESGLLLRLLENKLVFIENTENEQKLMKNFKKACECGRGGIFLTVAREKCLELLNQYGKFVRCSLVFGVPQGGVLSRVLRARLVYLKKHLNVDEADYLNYDAMRDAVWAVSQGVKSSSKQQAVIFVDKRFDSVQKRTRIPKWILNKIKSQNSVSKDSAKDICSKYFKNS